jgi:hypothetical protein
MWKNNWFYPLSLFMLLDLLSTTIGIGFYNMIEQNPFMARFWHVGDFATIGYMFILGFLAIYGANEYFNKKTKVQNIVVMALTISWVFIVSNNTAHIVSFIFSNIL